MVLALSDTTRAALAADLHALLGDLLQLQPGGGADCLDHLAAMAEHQVRRLPVISDQRLVGIVSQADVARAMPENKVGQVVEAIST